MNFGIRKTATKGWRYEGWRSCADLNIPGEIEGAPAYLRCMRCYRLVTHGDVKLGGCVCGFRKLNPCLALTWPEILLLKLGWFPLVARERKAIRPWAHGPCFHIRNRLLRPHVLMGAR